MKLGRLIKNIILKSIIIKLPFATLFFLVIFFDKGIFIQKPFIVAILVFIFLTILDIYAFLKNILKDKDS